MKIKSGASIGFELRKWKHGFLDLEPLKHRCVWVWVRVCGCGDYKMGRCVDVWVFVYIYIYTCVCVKGVWRYLAHPGYYILATRSWLLDVGGLQV